MRLDHCFCGVYGTFYDKRDTVKLIKFNKQLIVNRAFLGGKGATLRLSNSAFFLCAE